MANVSLRHIYKIYDGGVTAVTDFNLEIADKEFIILVGPSGCGKSTTLRMIAGLEDISKGELYIGDMLANDVAPKDRDIAMVFQNYALYPHMTVYDNVAFPLKLKNISAQEIEKRTTDALRHTNLLSVAKKSPDDLSGGGKQRVALARALAINPDVMLLDEPLSSLDPHLREEMRFEIKALQKKFGFSIIYVTHDQSEAMALSDRIMVMKKGAVQQIDTPLNIYNNPANKFVFNFIGLSNQLNVNLSSQGIHIDKVDGIFNLPEMPNNDLLSQGKAILASRPSDIEFVQQGGIPGVVKRRSYLGEVTDYNIQVGDQDIRVQIGRRDSGPKEGETCQIAFEHLHWYPAE